MVIIIQKNGGGGGGGGETNEKYAAPSRTKMKSATTITKPSIPLRLRPQRPQDRLQKQQRTAPSAWTAVPTRRTAATAATTNCHQSRLYHSTSYCWLRSNSLCTERQSQVAEFYGSTRPFSNFSTPQRRGQECRKDTFLHNSEKSPPSVDTAPKGHEVSVPELRGLISF